MRGKMVCRIMVAFSVTITFVFIQSPGFGADYPTKQIKIIVATDPGSGVDRDTRSIIPLLEKHLGVRIAVENIPGADSKVGFSKFSRSKPDGYTLLTHTHPAEIIVKRIFQVDYNVDEFSPVYAWTADESVLVVPAGRWKTLEEFVKSGRETPLKVGAPARGSPSHFNAIRFVEKLGIKVRWVPFEGGAQPVVEVAGGHLDWCISAPSLVNPMLQAGKVSSLVLLSKARSKFYPNVPIAKELGYDEWPNIHYGPFS